MEKNVTNSTSATLIVLTKVLYEDAKNTQWRKVKQSLPMGLRILLWERFEDTFFERTVKENKTNVTNLTLPLLKQATWRDIWKHTAEESQTNATNVICFLPGGCLEETFDNAQ